MTTTLRRLDHVNLRTSSLAAMTTWYVDMLGMRAGDRPLFSFPGAWLYIGDHPVLHLVGIDAPAGARDDLALEHFAFAATGLTSLIEKAEATDTRYALRKVPGFPIVQVNLWDPDGNHIHVDFDVAEADAAGLSLD